MSEQTANFAVGDKVSFTIGRGRGEGYRLSSREGSVQEVHPKHVIVKYQWKHYCRGISEVRKAGQPSALTEAFLKMGTTEVRS